MIGRRAFAAVAALFLAALPVAGKAQDGAGSAPFDMGAGAPAQPAPPSTPAPGGGANGGAPPIVPATPADGGRPATAPTGTPAAGITAAPQPSRPSSGSGVPFTAAPITAAPGPAGSSPGPETPPFQMGIEPSQTIIPNFVPDADEAPADAASAPPGSAAPIRPTAGAAESGRVDRPILPQPDLRLTGETDYREITVYLSQAEIERRARFSIGYVNAVLVMPEASRLRVTVNGQPVIDVPIEASTAARQVEAAVPAGALRAGANTVRVSAVQRHRVDCSLRATYELWTLLVPDLTGFSFDGGAPPVTGIADLPSIGVGTDGATRIEVVPVGAAEPARTSRIITATQAISVMGRFEHPVVEFVDAATLVQPEPGVLRVVVGAAAAIRPVTDVAAGEAAAQPVVALMPDLRTGVPTVVISGPTLEDADRALARFVLQAERSTREPAGRTQRWHAPDVPLFVGGEEMPLRDLGVRTEEFSGRRFQTHFSMALPADFYAAAYGEAALLLDAAFSPEVRPGSAIDIYVNDALAVTVNLTSDEGGLFRKRLVKIPLRSFRPGPNRISLEANLFTQADERCLPGATMPGRERFVLFDTSLFRIANFARFGELPNLAAFSAGGFPYDSSGETPLPLFVAGEGSSAAAAAATLLDRLSVSTGRPIPVRVVATAADVGGGPAVMVGTPSDLGPEIIGELGIADALASAWGAGRSLGREPAGAPQSIDRYEQVLTQLRSRRSATEDEPTMRQPAPTVPPPSMPDDLGIGDSGEILARWQSDVAGRGIGALFGRFTAWLNTSFGLTMDMIHLAPSPTNRVQLAPRTSLVIAQVRDPGTASATWTVATAPTSVALLSGMEGITAPQTWRTLSGSVASYQESSGLVRSFTPGPYYYVQTVPFSVENMRLIAANWFSVNVLEYALALILASAALGFVTWLLLRQIGREDNG